MAFAAAQLTQMSQGNGYSTYRYDTLDTHATVDDSGYFNNADDSVIFRIGDIIDVVVWATAIRTGTISTYGRHIVNAVSGAGVVDTSDVTVGTVTDTN